MARRVISALAGALLLATTTTNAVEFPKAKPEEVGMSSAILDNIGKELLNATISRVIPGGVTMVARHGKLVYTKAVGYDNPDYIFRLFSQTKPVTAVATLILMDEGKIHLDDPVTKFIPEFAALRVIKDGTLGAPIETVPLKTPITIWNLLTHTAGFVYGDGGDTTVDELYKAAQVLDLWNQDLDGFILKLARIPLLFQPGEQWKYSVGFDILGAVVQRASGVPFDVFLQKRVFGPLDMKDTGFYVPPTKLYRLVPYWANPGMPGVLIPLPNSYSHSDFTKVPRLKSGGGGLASTARDFLRFGQMILNKGVSFDGKRIVSEQLIEQMLTNQLPAELLPYKMGPVTFKNNGFGYGVALQTVTSTDFAPEGEASWGGAASTNWWVCPETDTVLIGMTQRSPFTNSVPMALKPWAYNAITDMTVFPRVEEPEVEERVEAGGEAAAAAVAPEGGQEAAAPEVADDQQGAQEADRKVDTKIRADGTMKRMI